MAHLEFEILPVSLVFALGFLWNADITYGQMAWQLVILGVGFGLGPVKIFVSGQALGLSTAHLTLAK